MRSEARSPRPLPSAALRLSVRCRFMLYAMTRDRMRTRVRKANDALYAAGAKGLRRSFQLRQLPMTPERLVRVLHALTDGLTFLRFLTPELITDDVVVATFDALAKASGD